MPAVWIILQHREGQLHRMAREAIAAGQQLAEITGGRPSAVLLGHGAGDAATEAAAYDLERVLVADHPALERYTPGAYVGALAPAIAAAGPAYVVAPHTYQTVDFLPRLAQATGAALVPEAIAFEPGDGGLVFRRPIMEGKLQARVKVKGEGPVLLSVQSGAFPADGGRAGEAPVASLEVGEIAADREILGVEQVGGDQVDLSKAEVVVAVGRGVGGADKMKPIEELAEVLGADVGASRPVIDNGWLPRDRQIGSSGQTVAPRLYFAIGISGAIQHLVGMKGAGCVVAINKDPSAPIFGVARYGLVGDLHEIVPALTEAIREAKG
ncbi:MAG: electron transfer flavoprotein subunit alpha/FixB family protein [Acidobacteria bacterium]|nr:MAG: electron transfer flavoprotein subunit alpha/FixB family protein [Acidobacteriota bacterium]